MIEFFFNIDSVNTSIVITNMHKCKVLKIRITDRLKKKEMTIKNPRKH